MDGSHPFAHVESVLASPPADGILITHVGTASPLPDHVAAGDVIVAVDDARSPDKTTFFKALQPLPDTPPTRRFEILGKDGSTTAHEVTLPLRGLGVCAVRKGVAGWEDAADCDDAPDFSTMDESGTVWLRNSLEETRSGFETMKLRRDGDLLDVEVLFALGGDDGNGGTWAYTSRALATVRLEPGLPAIRTAFWEGDALRGDLRLEDGVWRGVRGNPDGTTRDVELPANAPFIPGYIVTLLPMTMPLREGASITVFTGGDGTAEASGRNRFVCTGHTTAKVDGADVPAWEFVQRHYGLDGYGGDERFYVTDDRKLVRVDWGPNYAGCWGEAVAPEHVLDGVPEHIRVPE